MAFFDLYRQLCLEEMHNEGEPVSDIWVEHRKVCVFNPEWQDVVKVRPRSDLFPFNVFAPSPYRSGYALWDWIVAGGRPRTRPLSQDRVNNRQYAADIAVKRGHNKRWCNHVWPLFAAGRLSEIDEIIDLPSMESGRGAKMLVLGHYMAHRRGDKKERPNGFWPSFMSTSSHFAQAMAELAVAEFAGIPINPHEDNSLPWGIVACPSPRTGFTDRPPILQQHFDLKTDPTNGLAFVCVGIEAAPPPLSVITLSSKKSPLDWWSLQPMRLHVCGWETAAWVYSQEIAAPLKFGWDPRSIKSAFTSPCADLLPMPGFKDFLEEARKHPTGEGFESLDFWLEQDWDKPGVPGLPCHACLLQSSGIDANFSLPSWNRLFDPKEPEAVMNEVRKDYRKRLRAVLHLIKKAKAEAAGLSISAYAKIHSKRRNLWEEALKDKRQAAQRRRRALR
jgi:hypothetical protein